MSGRSGNVCLGDRVDLSDAKSGIVRYIGPVEGKEGQFVGLELDTGTGLNDGCVGGKRYFECADKKGLFMSVQSARKLRRHIAPGTVDRDGINSRYFRPSSLVSPSRGSEASEEPLTATTVSLALEQENGRLQPLSTSPVSKKLRQSVSGVRQQAAQGAVFEKMSELQEQIAMMEIENEHLRQEISREKDSKFLGRGVGTAPSDDGHGGEFHSFLHEDANRPSLKEELEQFKLKYAALLKADLEAKESMLQRQRAAEARVLALEAELQRVRTLNGSGQLRSNTPSATEIALQAGRDELKAELAEQKQRMADMQERLAQYQRKEMALMDFERELKEKQRLIERELKENQRTLERQAGACFMHGHEEIERERDELRKQTERLKEQLEENGKHVEKLRKEKDENERQAEEQRRHCEEMKRRFEEQKRRAEEYKEHCAEYKKKTEDSMMRYDELKRTVGELQVALENSTAEKEALMAESSRAAEDSKAMKLRFDERLAQATARADKAEKECVALRLENEQVKKDEAELREDLRSVKLDNEELRQRVETDKNFIAQLQRKVEDADAEKAQMLSAHIAAKRDAEAAIKALEDELEFKDEVAADRVRSECAALGEQVQKIQAQVAHANREAESVKKKLLETERALEKAKEGESRAQQTVEELRELETQLKKAQEGEHTAQATIEKLLRELQSERDARESAESKQTRELGALKTLLTEKQRALDALETRVEELQAQLGDAERQKAHARHADGEVSALKELIRRKEREVEGLVRAQGAASVAEVQRQIDAMRAKISEQQAVIRALPQPDEFGAVRAFLEELIQIARGGSGEEAADDRGGRRSTVHGTHSVMHSHLSMHPPSANSQRDLGTLMGAVKQQVQMLLRASRRDPENSALEDELRKIEDKMASEKLHAKRDACVICSSRAHAASSCPKRATAPYCAICDEFNSHGTQECAKIF